MKLYIPDGLENSDINEKLSPTIGHPKLPGIPTMLFGDEVHDRSTKKADNTKTDSSNATGIKINSAIAKSLNQKLPDEQMISSVPGLWTC